MNNNDFSSAKWGNNINALMDIHDIGVKDLAAELGITVRGVKALTAQRAAQLQAALKTDYHKIFPLVMSEN
jgi:hypothetical protein